ncbi:MAG: GAF domain-containing protein, partial [Sterolibacterium sp.]
MSDERGAQVPLRILHLEDSPRDAEIIRERLIDAGLSMQVDWAADERQFSSLLLRGGYDLILADYLLPGFDAPAALLLTKTFCPDIPFIAVSGAIGEENAVELLRLGATDYVLKDNLRKLPLAIERALDEAREQRARRQAEDALLRLTRELRAVSNSNQALVRADDEQALLEAICRNVCDEAGYRMAWVGYAANDDAKTIRPLAWAGDEAGYLEQIRVTWSDTARGQGPAGMAIRSGEPAYCQDFATDPLLTPWRESALQRGYRSAIAFPLKDESATAFGVLLIYSAQINAF